MYERYQRAELTHAEKAYGQTLRTAWYVVGRVRLFALLEEAERTGQRLELAYPIPIEQGPSEPYDVVLTHPGTDYQIFKGNGKNSGAL